MHCCAVVSCEATVEFSHPLEGCRNPVGCHASEEEQACRLTLASLSTLRLFELSMMIRRGPQPAAA